MRLGGYECHVTEGTKLYDAYKKADIVERHRHRYEFNNEFRELFVEKGMIPAGVNPASDLIEAVEIKNHTWYVGVQFHPEYSSTVLHPHPLFLSFVRKLL